MGLEDVAPTLSAVVGVDLEGVDGTVRHDVIGTTPGGAGRERPGSTARRPRPPVDPTTAAAQLAASALDVATSAARRGDIAVRAELALADLEEQVERVRATADELERSNLVWTTMRWLDGIEVDEDRLVTVITPTYERPTELVKAIGSVVAQSYRRWELIVVDDGGDTAKSVVAEIGDERVRAHRIEHRGVCGARNAALDLAVGDIVTYLDDDNELDPGWLKAVVWGFQTHPEVDVLYGARLIDDVERVNRRPSGGWPWLQFNRFDRGSLLAGNLADIGVMAHRRQLDDARFDERLQEFGDWDLFLTLTRERRPLELPALAVRYRTDRDDRLSGKHPEELALMHEKWTTPRPWRPDQRPS